jgi:myo-inositol-1(or 4)-monophosphatase
LADALIGCGVPHLGKAKNHAKFLNEFSAIMQRVSNLRRLGAASLDLCCVAAGSYDGYWERDLKSWDIAAGILIVREAGGFVSDLDGGSDMLAKGSICVGNETIQSQLLAALRAAAG